MTFSTKHRLIFNSAWIDAIKITCADERWNLHLTFVLTSHPHNQVLQRWYTQHSNIKHIKRKTCAMKGNAIFADRNLPVSYTTKTNCPKFENVNHKWDLHEI